MSERWARIGQIFAEALWRPEAARESFLADACAGDAALLAEVRSLLEHHTEADGFLEDGKIVLPAEDGEDAAPPALAGDRFGAWRIVRPLGAGGMGDVFEVERVEGSFVQRGALKLISAGLASEEMIRRFRRERQILARLDHPNIARLLDGGETPDGLPYLVMEYVEGEPLLDYSAGHALDLEARIALFLTICEAVASAHQKLVLHRDLKPSNILVTADGAPKLLDFGIGKMFDDEVAGVPADLRTISLPLTPAYASPEQIRGEAADTASDQYSLGVVLYTLLTGERPYDPPTDGAADAMQAVLTTEPRKPSTVAKGAVRRRLSGDLDTIVLKSLAKEPARRYGSVALFAADLERWRDGQTIAARPDAWSYRAGKFVRRNRILVLAGTIAVLALVAGLGLALWQASVARRQTALAERRFADVRSLANTLLFDLNDSLATMAGAAPTRGLIIDRATAYLDRLSRDAGRDTALLGDLADAYDRLGSIQGGAYQTNLGHTQDAVASFRKSLAMREELARARPNDGPTLVSLLQTASKLANLEIERGEGAEALRLHRRALAANERLIRVFPESTVYRAVLPRRQYNVALGMLANGDQPGSLALMRRTLAGFDSLARANPKSESDARALAQVAYGFAQNLLSAPGGTDEAVARLRQSAAIFEPLHRAKPTDAMTTRRLAAPEYVLSRLALLRRSDPDSAALLAASVSALLAPTVARDPGNADLALSLQIARANEGLMWAAAGKPERAEPILRSVLPELERGAKADTSDTRYPLSLEDVHEGFGNAAIARGRTAERAGKKPQAKAAWNEALQWFTKARAEFDGLRARGQSWDLSKEQSARLDRLLVDSRQKVAAYTTPTEAAAARR